VYFHGNGIPPVLYAIYSVYPRIIKILHRRYRLYNSILKINCGNLYEIQVYIRFFFGSYNTLRNKQNGFNEDVQYSFNQNHLVLIYIFIYYFAKKYLLLASSKNGFITQYF